MADDREKLRTTLHELQTQLAATSSIDPAAAERLRQAIAEVDDALAGKPPAQPAAEQSLAERLSDAALGFEASHPTLAGTVGSVIDALAQMGI